MILRGCRSKHALPIVSRNGSSDGRAHIHKINGLPQTNFNHFFSILSIIEGRNRGTFRIGRVHQKDTHFGRTGIRVTDQHTDRDIPCQPISPRNHCCPSLICQVIIGSTRYDPRILGCIVTHSCVSHSPPFAGENTVGRLQLQVVWTTGVVVSEQAFRFKIRIDV